MRCSPLGLLVALSGVAAAAPGDLHLSPDTRQLLLVTTPSWSATAGTLRRYARDGKGGPWREVAETAPRAVVIGKGGLGWGRGLHPEPGRKDSAPRKKEGDGRSPAGVFTLVEATGYNLPPPTGTTLSYRRATDDLRCVDDPHSPLYNRLAVESHSDPSPAWTSAEKMRRDDGLYELTILVAHNTLPRPISGEGSCIFLHVWRDESSPTIGCTAMPLPQLSDLLGWLSADANPVLVQLPAPVLKRLAARWGLPAPR